MKVYTGHREPGDWPVILVHEKHHAAHQTRRLVITRVFAPVRFDWGFLGECALETAHSILADHLGNTASAERYAAVFAVDIVSRLPKENWGMSSDYIEEALRRYNPDHGLSPCAVVDFTGANA